jgi:hypothetical protein
MPGAGRTRDLACKESCALRTQASTGQPKHSGIPCAVVYDLLCALPGVSGFLVTVAVQIVLHNLTPASRGQDHAAWSYAPLAIVSQANTSTAPRLTYRDDWPNVPLHEAGCGECNVISVFRKTFIFAERA